MGEYLGTNEGNNPGNYVDDRVDPIIKQDLEYHKYMIDLVPPQFYFGGSQKNVFKQSQKIGEDSDSEEESSKKKKEEDDVGYMKQLKRSRYDPSFIKTTSQLQEELVEREQKNSLENSPVKKKKKKKLVQTGQPRKDGQLKTTTDSMEELREKLQAKIDSLKAKRNALGKEDNITKKRMKRQLSKMKLKMQQKMAKQNRVKGEQGTLPNGEVKPKAPNSSGKPIYNKEGKMVFSKFDFSSSGEKSDKQDLLAGKNYSKLLEKVKRQKEKIEKLKETDMTKAKNLQEKTSWQTALQKAEGVKIKDNTELLKKAAKRKEKLKKKSTKNWEERTHKVQERQKEQQEKRRKNIKARKQQKVKKKIDKAKKKGRIIPGF